MRFTPQILPSNPTLRRAFTLSELLVVMAIMAILASLLFSVVSRTRESARRTMCASNLKQIGLSLQQYVEDNDGYYPTIAFDGYDKTCQASYWSLPPATLNEIPLLPKTLAPYANDARVFVCPSTQTVRDNDADGAACEITSEQFQTWPMTYIQRTELSMDAVRVSAVSNATLIDALHCHGNFHGGADPEKRVSNVLFLDGHVKLLQRVQLIETSATPWSYN